MIRVNLIGDAKKKSARTPGKSAAGNAVGSSDGNVTAFDRLFPMILVAIVLVSGIGGYFWYSSLADQTTDLTSQIGQAEAQKTTLEAVIRQSEIYEGRKKELENRIRIIDGLKRNQVSPVVSLDILDDAIDRTRYVWLSSLDQNNAVFSMSGVGTSVNALADFVSNLEDTGYFRNINLVNAQDAAGNYTFSITCEFGPPAHPPAAVLVQNSGAN